MTKLHIIQYEDVHRDQYYQLNLEYIEWADNEFAARYNTPLNPSGTAREYLDCVFPKYVIAPPDGVILVLVGEEGLVGMGVVKRLEEDVGEIVRVYIRHGSRGGYGKKLVNRLIEEAKRLGHKKLELNTAKFMEAAQHIYRAVGFKETGYHHGNPENPDQVTSIHMEMSLSKR